MTVAQFFFALGTGVLVVTIVGLVVYWVPIGVNAMVSHLFKDNTLQDRIDQWASGATFLLLVTVATALLMSVGVYTLKRLGLM